MHDVAPTDDCAWYVPAGQGRHCCDPQNECELYVCTALNVPAGHVRHVHGTHEVCSGFGLYSAGHSEHDVVRPFATKFAGQRRHLQLMYVSPSQFCSDALSTPFFAYPARGSVLM